MAKDVTLLIKLQDAVSGKVRAIAGASKKAEAAIQKLQRAVEGVGRKFDRLKSKASAGLSAIAAKAKNAAKSFGGFGKAAAIAASAAGALASLRFAFTQAGELEKATRSLKVLTGSLDDAKRIISELQAFGAVTPFTSAELIDTAKRLKAFGFETEKIVDVTQRLADVAGATGADLGGIATAFGQIQAKGRLQGEELLQLQERGINLQDELQKMYGLTGDEFRKALEKGRFSAEAVNLALVKLTSTGGKYAEGAIAQSDTLFGKLSTLQDAFIRLGQNIGKALEPIFKFLIDQTTRLVNAINGIFARNAAINAVRQRQKEKGMGGRTLGRFMGSAAGIAAVEAELAKRQAAPAGGTGLSGPNAQPPELLGGTGGGNGAGGRVDASKELLALNQRLFESAKPLSKLEKISLEFQLEKQRILDQDLGVNEEKIQLLQAAAGFEQDLIDYRNEQIKLQQKEIDTRMGDFENQMKHQDQLSQLLQKENQIFEQIGQTIQDGLVRGIEDAITGAKSLREALSGVLKSIGGTLLRSAITSAVGGINFGGGSSGGTPEVLTSGINFFGAEGGYASGATNAVIGEAGPEYLIPENKMRESMARYSRGVRGSAVIPKNGEGGTNGMGGGTAVAAPIDVRYTVERINSVDYVTADQFQRGMQQAAADGAKQGEQRALTTLRQNTSQRRRIGLS